LDWLVLTPKVTPVLRVTDTLCHVRYSA
jgi:hypothetical protein